MMLKTGLCAQTPPLSIYVVYFGGDFKIDLNSIIYQCVMNHEIQHFSVADDKLRTLSEFFDNFSKCFRQGINHYLKSHHNIVFNSIRTDLFLQ